MIIAWKKNDLMRQKELFNSKISFLQNADYKIKIDFKVYINPEI